MYDHRIDRYALTLSCDPPLACRVALVGRLALDQPLDLTRAQVDAAIDRVVERDARSLVARFLEPLEAIVAARQLVEQSGPALRWDVRGLAASGPAAALLGDGAQPTRSTLRWLLDQLGIDELADGPVVAAAQAGSHAPESIAVPLLALRFPEVIDGMRVPGHRIYDRAQVVIGRGARHADIVIEDANIARRHCGFLRSDGGWLFQDLGSSGGCDLDGQRVDNLRVAHGDVFRLAGHAIEVIAVL